ncbi:MAG: YggT family protein [Candidatus Dasytiphilus stammeri]
MIGLIMLAKSIGFLILEIIIIHSLRSWMMQSYHPIDEILDKLTEHILNPVRDFIPVVWGIDFSPIIIVLILYIMNYLGMNLFPKMWNLI